MMKTMLGLLRAAVAAGTVDAVVGRMSAAATRNAAIVPMDRVRNAHETHWLSSQTAGTAG